MNLIPTLLVTYIIVCSVQADDGPIVNTAIGTIRGVRSDDGQYNMYMGIPYARVNDSNPFGASLPYPHFEGIFEANDDSSICPQIEEFNNTIVGDLDCLHLNIYTPTNVNANSRLSTFVWIYGGGFNIGFYGRFLYGPKYLTRHNIIVVTINYRLGPYGFMCLDIPEVPGNQGLKDQIIAMRWLNAHISAFGGDPDLITIGGNSAGSVSADFHLHRDNSDEQLFSKVVLHSGTVLALSYSEPSRDVPITLAKYFEYDTDDIYEALNYLAGVPPKDLIFAQSSLGISVGSICIEKYFEDVENYLTVNWHKKYNIPAVNDMSVLIGVNSDELGIMKSRNARFINGVLEGIFYSEHEEFIGMADLINQFYLSEERSIVDNIDNRADFLSDTSFVHPTYRTIYRYIENKAKNIYFYNFSYVGERNFVRRLNNLDSSTVGGAFHADEIPYLFDSEFIPEKPTADDQIVIDKMTKMWANFVKYGDPTPELTDLIDVKWEPISRNSSIYSMNINTQLSLDTSPIADRITFWDVFYEKNGHLQRVMSFN